MTTIQEGRLEFTFDPDIWPYVVKYDDEPFYIKISNAIDCTKAVDIIIARNNEVVFWEIKDFRGHRTENKGRLSGDGPDSLPMEIAQKFRDTIPVLFSAWRAGNANPLHHIAGFIFNNNTQKIEVVLFLELDKQPAGPWDNRLANDNIERKINGKLHKFGVRAKVYSSTTLPDNKGWNVRKHRR